MAASMKVRFWGGGDFGETRGRVDKVEGAELAEGIGSN